MGYAILHAFVSISMHAFHVHFSCTHFMHRWPDPRDADVVPILTSQPPDEMWLDLSDADVVPNLTSQPPDQMCVLAGCTFRVRTGLCVKYPILPHSLVPLSSCKLRLLHFQQTMRPAFFPMVIHRRQKRSLVGSSMRSILKEF